MLEVRHWTILDAGSRKWEATGDLRERLEKVPDLSRIIITLMILPGVLIEYHCIEQMYYRRRIQQLLYVATGLIRLAFWSSSGP